MTLLRLTETPPTLLLPPVALSAPAPGDPVRSELLATSSTSRPAGRVIVQAVRSPSREGGRRWRTRRNNGLA